MTNKVNTNWRKYEQVRDQVVDPRTGEVYVAKSDKLTTIQQGVSEERFVKIYYETYLATLGAGESALSPFLLELGKRMAYSDQGQIIHLTKGTRAEIAKNLGCSDVNVRKMTKKLCDLGVLARIDGPHSATYLVSPFIIAKGDWKDIQALQLTYDARLGQMGVEVPRPKYLAEAHKQGYQLVADEGTPTLPEPEVASYTRPDPEKIALEAQVGALQQQLAELQQKIAAESDQIPGQTSLFDAPQKPEK